MYSMITTFQAKPQPTQVVLADACPQVVFADACSQVVLAGPSPHQPWAARERSNPITLAESHVR